MPGVRGVSGALIRNDVSRRPANALGIAPAAATRTAFSPQEAPGLYGFFRRRAVAMEDYGAVISPTYDRVIRKTLVAQVVVGCLAALMLDGGTTARVVGVAVVAFWLGAAVVILRRPHEPTKLDLVIIHWGFWIVLAIAALRQTFA